MPRWLIKNYLEIALLQCCEKLYSEWQLKSYCNFIDVKVYWAFCVVNDSHLTSQELRFVSCTSILDCQTWTCFDIDTLSCWNALNYQQRQRLIMKVKDETFKAAQENSLILLSNIWYLISRHVTIMQFNKIFLGRSSVAMVQKQRPTSVFENSQKYE